MIIFKCEPDAVEILPPHDIGAIVLCCSPACFTSLHGIPRHMPGTAVDLGVFLGCQPNQADRVDWQHRRYLHLTMPDAIIVGTRRFSERLVTMIAECVVAERPVRHPVADCTVLAFVISRRPSIALAIVQSPTADHRPPTIDFRLPSSVLRPLLTNHQPPASAHQFPSSGLRPPTSACPPLCHRMPPASA